MKNCAFLLTVVSLVACGRSTSQPENKFPRSVDETTQLPPDNSENGEDSDSLSQEVENSPEISMGDFPKKWVALYEARGELVRKQLCGDERYIEITQSGNNYILREIGYQDIWEAAIVDFSEQTGFTLKVDKGNDLEKMTIKIISDWKGEYSEGVCKFNGRAFTAKPDLFQVDNDTTECL